MIPSLDRVNELLRYQENDGQLIWRVSPRRNVKIGDEAGHLTVGPGGRYIRITIDRRRYMAHTVIWYMKTGEWRPRELDHINGDGTNNRWSNLRQCSERQNNGNRRVLHNKLGYKGIGYRAACTNRPYYAQINIGDRQKVIGYFSTPEEAAAAYDKAALEIFGTFALPNSQMGG